MFTCFYLFLRISLSWILICSAVFLDFSYCLKLSSFLYVFFCSFITFSSHILICLSLFLYLFRRMSVYPYLLPIISMCVDLCRYLLRCIRSFSPFFFINLILICLSQLLYLSPCFSLSPFLCISHLIFCFVSTSFFISYHAFPALYLFSLIFSSFSLSFLILQPYVYWSISNSSSFLPYSFIRLYWFSFSFLTLYFFDSVVISYFFFNLPVLITTVNYFIPVPHSLLVFFCFYCMYLYFFLSAFLGTGSDLD